MYFIDFIYFLKVANDSSLDQSLGMRPLLPLVRLLKATFDFYRRGNPTG